MRGAWVGGLEARFEFSLSPVILFDGVVVLAGVRKGVYDNVVWSESMMEDMKTRCLKLAIDARGTAIRCAGWSWWNLSNYRLICGFDIGTVSVTYGVQCVIEPPPQAFVVHSPCLNFGFAKLYNPIVYLADVVCCIDLL